ncbi:unnamed protein product [Pleuronectes platessa]|uniref:Stress-associated endoplasmic reticulum protein n=1 Tax=Pleuronectes platessa TaxID=8262 RepID=A0A9N7TUR9_PLEPL|nr:unnamed protein product [Pleuronectes platessa]
MVAKQRIRMANEKHSKNITQRGNVAKTLVRRSLTATRRRHTSPDSDHKRKSILWAPGCSPSLYLLCVDQPYFRSFRAFAWGCDSEGASGPLPHPPIPSLSLVTPREAQRLTADPQRKRERSFPDHHLHCPRPPPCDHHSLWY